jgi:hypothetical protein
LAGLAIGPQGFALLAPSKGTEFLSDLGVVLLMLWWARVLAAQDDRRARHGVRCRRHAGRAYHADRCGHRQLALASVGKPPSSWVAWSACRRPLSPSSSCRTTASSPASTAASLVALALEAGQISYVASNAIRPRVRRRQPQPGPASGRGERARLLAVTFDERQALDGLSKRRVSAASIVTRIRPRINSELRDRVEV